MRSRAETGRTNSVSFLQKTPCPLRHSLIPPRRGFCLPGMTALGRKRTCKSAVGDDFPGKLQPSLPSLCLSPRGLWRVGHGSYDSVQVNCPDSLSGRAVFQRKQCVEVDDRDVLCVSAAPNEQGRPGTQRNRYFLPVLISRSRPRKE